MRLFLQLIKWRISLAVSFTSLAAWLVFYPRVDLSLLGSLLGVFLMASAASVLNQYQERRSDALMYRTRYRPLPAGTITPGNALLIFVLLLLAGSLLLWYFAGVAGLLLGLSNLLWYNGLYTPLKRKSTLAVIPGSLTGAVPALIGWVAAGGSLVDLQIWIIALFLMLWQVPHFWLLLMHYDADYQRAGFPSIYRSHNPQQLQALTFVWALGTSAVTLLFPVYRVLESLPLVLLLLFFNVLMILRFYRWAAKVVPRGEKATFAGFNLYMALVLACLIVDQFLL